MPVKNKKRKGSTLSSNRPKKSARTYQHEILTSKQHPIPYYFHAKRIYLFQTPYIPQYKDHVVFLRQGIVEFYEQNGGNPYNKPLPQEIHPNLPPQLECIISDIKYLLVGDDVSTGTTLFRLTLDPINDSEMNNKQTTSTFPPFEIDYLEIIGNPDYLIPWSKWKAACKLEEKLSPGTSVEVNFDSHWWTGKVLELSPSDPKFPDSMWENVLVEWKDGSSSRVSVWEIRDLQYELEPDFKAPLDFNATKKITLLLDEFMDYKLSTLPLLQGAYPIILSTVTDRLKAQYYRQWESFEFEFQWIVDNVRKIKQDKDIKEFLELKDKIFNIIKDVKNKNISPEKSQQKSIKSASKSPTSAKTKKQSKTKKSIPKKTDKDLDQKLAGLFDTSKSSEKIQTTEDSKQTKKQISTTESKKKTSGRKKPEKKAKSEEKVKKDEITPISDSSKTQEPINIPSQGGEEEEIYYGEPYGSPPRDETNKPLPLPVKEQTSGPELPTEKETPESVEKVKEKEKEEIDQVTQKDFSKETSKLETEKDESGEETEESEDEKQPSEEPSIVSRKKKSPEQELEPPLSTEIPVPMEQDQGLTEAPPELEETGEQPTPVGPQLPEEMTLTQKTTPETKEKTPPRREPISFGLNTNILTERKKKEEAEAEKRKKKLMQNPMKEYQSHSELMDDQFFILENEDDVYNPIKITLKIKNSPISTSTDMYSPIVQVSVDENPIYDHSLEEKRNSWLQNFDAWKESTEWHTSQTDGIYTSKDRELFEKSINWSKLGLPKNKYSSKFSFKAPFVNNTSPVFSKFFELSPKSSEQQKQQQQQSSSFVYLMKTSKTIVSLAEKEELEEEDDNYNVREEIQKIMEQIYGKKDQEEEDDDDEGEFKDKHQKSIHEQKNRNQKMSNNEDLPIVNTEKIFPYQLRAVTLCVCIRKERFFNVEESTDIEMQNLENEEPDPEEKTFASLQLEVNTRLSDIEKMRLEHLQECVNRYQTIMETPHLLIQYPQPQEIRRMCELYSFLLKSNNSQSLPEQSSREYQWNQAGFYMTPVFSDEIDNTWCSVIQIVGINDSLNVSINNHTIL